MALSDTARARILIAAIKEAMAKRHMEKYLVDLVVARLRACRKIGAKEATSRVLDAVRVMPNVTHQSPRDWKLAIYDAVVTAGAKYDKDDEAEA